MPRYTYSLEDGVPIAALDANEKFADNRAAVEHAKLIAKDLARSLVARRHLRVVVRNQAGAEIGAVPLVASRPWGAAIGGVARAPHLLQHDKLWDIGDAVKVLQDWESEALSAWPRWRRGPEPTMPA